MAGFGSRVAMLGWSGALVAGVFAAGSPAAAEPSAEPSGAPSAKAAYQWVALGDSYTAGVISAAGDTYEAPRDGCQRTDRSYPQVIDRELGPLFDAVNVSCGGATIADITFGAQEPTGHHLPLFGVEDPDYPFPAVPPQSAAVGPDTDVITVGVGGNTLGFAEILGQCALLAGGDEGTPCRDALAGGIDDRLAEVGRQYEEMLTVLHERAPEATILAVGYPTIIPADANECEYANTDHFGTIARGDLEWLREDVLEPLNERIAGAVAAQQAATFVDLYESSTNHSVCADTNWVEGLTARGTGQLAFVHPNALGHRNAADQVAVAMLDAVSPR